MKEVVFESKSQNIEKKHKDIYLSFLKKLPNNGELITDLDFIEDNPAFYLYYPKLFSSAFKFENSDLDKLCIAGYLFYQSTIFLDAVIDSNDNNKLIAAMISQEEAVKLLTSIFGLKSNYWELWNKRRNEYLKAVYIEKSYSKSDNQVTIEEYGHLADLKSAFGKAAIDALFVLDDESKNDTYSNLLESHKFFSIAFQINDDVLDFKEDFINGQFNWAVYTTKYDNSAILDIDKQKKLFYIRGHAKKLFLEAIHYLNLALGKVEQINVPLWKTEVLNLKVKFQSSIIEIDNYLELLNSDISLSEEFKGSNEIKISIDQAIGYLSGKQKEDGSWREYLNQGGISDVWSTAFICSHLTENRILKEKMQANINDSIGFIKNNKFKTLWGYNTTWIEDADTTNFVLMTFVLNSVDIEDKVLNSWANYQQSDQGFSTYCNADYLLESLSDRQIFNVDGWTQSHQCVSAVAWYFLIISDEETKISYQLQQFFDRKLHENQINAYWWTSSIYTYNYLIKCYFKLGQKDKVDQILTKVVLLQEINGSFKDDYGENLFISGLALQILLHDRITYKSEIEKLVDYLLSKQFKDGSWSNSHTLQIPDPSKQGIGKANFPISSHGTSVRAREFNRLFTTTCVLKSLTDYYGQ